MPQEPDRNLALELVRVTEAAALAAGRWMGRGDRNAADRAAVEAMRLMLRSIDMDGVVVIGEGEKDEAPMLYNGERIGNGRPPQVDVAVDPIDGTRLLALGRPGAIAVVALSERGTMFSPGRIVYMNKLAVGPEAREVIDLDAPIPENLRRIAWAKGKHVDDLTVVILERDRHADLIREVRAAGARIKLITDGDVSAALMTAFPDSGIDVLVGIGGSPEAVITAAALKCLGGEIHARLWPRNEEERRFAAEMGYDLQRILTADDLVRGDNIFFAATGITDGEILRGVRYTGNGARTHSVVMRSRSGTIRFVEADHRWDKLMRISGYPYDQGAGAAPPPAR
ncbi:class II fructose-bisphosphatase [Thermoflexus sp.]|uniref:class II fructose-bisphosphatase n=1 Tax=Thermoflexus sp. TaxID=1969742 RepID=UPI0035E457CD